MSRNIVHPDGQQTTIRRMCIACWVPKATNTNSEYVIHIAFRCNNGCTDSPQCCVIHTLPVLLIFTKLKKNGQEPTWAPDISPEVQLLFRRT